MADVDVRVLADGRIRPANPPAAGSIRLSFYDVMWLPLPPIQRLFLFDTADVVDVIEPLKSSLATALGIYFPLAGRLTYVASTDDVIVDCSDAAVGDGVAFIEAASDHGDIGRLVDDEAHDVPAFSRLVPELDTRVLPAPVLAVQVTGFAPRGVALGVSVHHAVADGQAVWRFMQAWAAEARNPDAEASAKMKAPTFDRAVLKHASGNPDGAAREIMRTFVPKLPVASWEGVSWDARNKLSRRTITVDGDHIASLKKRLSNVTLHREPSTFVALSAAVWTAFVAAKSLQPGEDTCFTFFMDCRPRANPPIDESYFGNCVVPCFVKADAGDVSGDSGLAAAAAAIQKEILDATAKLVGTHDWVYQVMTLPKERTTNVVASPRFKVYETDFGFGKPRRVELVSMNHDGEVVLVGAASEGDVQASVAMSPDHITAFKSHFLDEFR